MAKAGRILWRNRSEELEKALFMAVLLSCFQRRFAKWSGDKLLDSNSGVSITQKTEGSFAELRSQLNISMDASSRLLQEKPVSLFHANSRGVAGHV
jgi:hypothetical protein